MSTGGQTGESDEWTDGGVTISILLFQKSVGFYKHKFFFNLFLIISDTCP